MVRKINSFANNWARRVAIALVLLTLPASSFAFISPAVKKNEFQGSVELQFCGQTADGRWEVLDTLKISNVRFSASLSEVNRTVEVPGQFAFEGKTASGKHVSVRMQRPAKGVFNLTEGKAAFSLPLKVTVEGKTTDLKLNMTTESVVAPNGGTIRGERLKVDQATGTVKWFVVGSELSQGLIAIFAPPPSAAEGKAPSIILVDSAVRVVMKLDGVIYIPTGEEGRIQ